VRRAKGARDRSICAAHLQNFAQTVVCAFFETERDMSGLAAVRAQRYCG
jgi:hypothetical protein